MEQTFELRQSRWLLGLLAVGYLVFAVYGSLVPLDYRPMPLDQAVDRFRGIRFLNLGIGSRADWVANLLLFVPLGFLWVGWLWPRFWAGRVLVSLLVWVFAVALCVGIEFTQLFFPPRTVSQNDILAESVGALVGIGLWWWFGPALWAWVQRWREVRGVTSVAEYLLLAYLAGMFFYNLLPLDLTISPVEMYHKWKSGSVNFIPFGFPYESPAMFVYGIATDVILWVPVSALWVIAGRRTPVQAFWWTFGALFLLEILQFFVYSRVSDMTDLITGAMGAGIGVIIGKSLRPRLALRSESLLDYDQVGVVPASTSHSSRRNLFPWILLGLVGWIGVLCVVFWFPFEFEVNRVFLRARFPSLVQVPFKAYYYGTEFRAVTEVLHKLLFFAPLGGVLALGRLQISRFSPLRHLYQLLVLVLILGVPMLIELGQVALPDKNPDSTDWVLEVIGAGAGYLLVIHVRNKMLLTARPRKITRRLEDAGGYAD